MGSTLEDVEHPEGDIFNYMYSVSWFFILLDFWACKKEEEKYDIDFSDVIKILSVDYIFYRKIQLLCRSLNENCSFHTFK